MPAGTVIFRAFAAHVAPGVLDGTALHWRGLVCTRRRNWWLQSSEVERRGTRFGESSRTRWRRNAVENTEPRDATRFVMPPSNSFV